MNKFLPLLVLLMTSFMVSCQRYSDGSKSKTTDSLMVVSVSGEPKQCSVVNKSHTLHLFVENSGSMNGYINTDSDFQMAIGRVIQLMKYKYGSANIKTYYINTRVYQEVKPSNQDIYEFVKNMLKKDNFKKRGSTASTDLNKIVEEVLTYVDEENTAILISDLIYSLKATSGVTTNLLYDCQNLTMSAFLEKTKEMQPGVSLATNLIQLGSAFEGHYWNWAQPTGNNYVNLKCMRPYYMCVLGTDANVKDFNKSISVESLIGYMNQFTISNKDMSNVSYTVFDTKYKKGSYKHGSEPSIKSIYSAKTNSRNEFELAIAVDLSDFTMSEQDKLDVLNYSIDQGNYSLVRVELIDTLQLLNPTDLRLIRENGCTHALVLKSSGYPNDIKISIKRSLPEWVEASSSLDDRRIAMDTFEQNKTFGLKYFVAGISDAYSYIAYDKENVAVIKVNVK